MPAHLDSTAGQLKLVNIQGEVHEMILRQTGPPSAVSFPDDVLPLGSVSTYLKEALSRDHSMLKKCLGCMQYTMLLDCLPFMEGKYVLS